MTNLVSLTNDLLHRSVGFNSLFDDFTRPADKYPLHNLRKEDNKYIIELAVAGFDKEDLSIERDGNRLTISGNQEKEVNDYIYKGISSRSFIKTFTINSTYEEIGADLHNGILTIMLEKQEDKSNVKRIEIHE